MAEKDTIFKGRVKQTGIFSFKKLYSFLYDWLSEEGYKINEDKYSEKITGDSKEIEINWEAEKEISDYFKFVIRVDWFILGLKNIKVKKEDKEINMNTGEVEIKFKTILVKDYESKWEDHPVWKFLRGIYDRYIIRTRIDDYEDRLMEDTDELIAQCKSFLAIEAKHTHVPYK